MPSKSRSIYLGCGAALLAGLVASPAAASAWERIDIVEPWQETITCGDVTGEASGTVVQRVFLRENEDGTVSFRLTERVENATFTGSDGVTYRVVGAGSASGYSQADSEEVVVDRQNINLVLVGPGGRLGAIHERVTASGRTVTGGCTF